MLKLLNKHFLRKHEATAYYGQEAQNPTSDSLSINTIRTPSMDAVQQANSDTLCSQRRITL